VRGSDFFARVPPRYRRSFCTWDGVRDKRHTSPSLRRLDSRDTSKKFRARTAEHKTGQIWSATLWNIRSALDQTLADKIIVESRFQLNGFTGFNRGARAILDPDRNLY
jgi:hypothetical protein